MPNGTLWASVFWASSQLCSRITRRDGQAAANTGARISSSRSAGPKNCPSASTLRRGDPPAAGPPPATPSPIRQDSVPGAVVIRSASAVTAVAASRQGQASS